jgi:hypothetical protein
MEHLAFRSTGESSQIGKSPEPLIIIWDNSGDLRLLEHELGNEDSVGIARPTPRKIAPIGAIPAGKSAAEERNVGKRFQRQAENVQRPTLTVQLRIQN